MYTLIKEKVDNVKKLMIYESENDGVYVFLYDTQEDKSSFADLWFETFDEAVDYCIEKYIVIEDQWVVIKDPKEGQQHDIIN
ncbi:hypothetical protein A3842_04060 [Paenibacillus sp. P3E]|uniref:hypothetical protein n=1 Tax=Paenibacillus sp. P3E TaxID=1349435 RepID=UPI000965EB53|nr:hypothetical protein [Paenibacillus sp. P3E]OKP89667.1 hypothetical protein A3842_04060 [Paenibacillus sp. P3E]